MKFLIRADASIQIGFGHFRRCISLAEILQELKAEIFIQTNINNPLLSYIPQDLKHDLDLLGSRKIGSTSDFEDLISYARKHQVDWIILDGYEYGSEFEKNIMLEGFKLLRIDDVPTHHYHCNILLSQNYGAENMPFSTLESAKKALGLNFLLLNKKFRSLPYNRRHISINPLKILVTLGGSSILTHDLYQIIAGGIKEFQKEDFVFHFIISDTETMSKVRSLLHDKSHCKFTGFTNQIEQDLLNSDFVLTSAGTTIWESIYIGTPLGVIPLNNLQNDYIQTLRTNKLCLTLSEKENLNSTDITHFFDSIKINYQPLNDLVRTYESIIERDKIVDRLKELLSL